MPMKGIKLGNIGPKVGYLARDNSFAKFDHVRIPRTNLLSRFCEVSRDGSFKLKGDQRIMYAMMMSIRNWIIKAAGYQLLVSLMIGTRYAVCRRQFATLKNSTEERKLIDYQIHMVKFGPLLAQAYAMMCGGKFVDDTHFAMLK